MQKKIYSACNFHNLLLTRAKKGKNNYLKVNFITIKTVQTHLTSDISGVRGRSPQYLKIHSKHSTERGYISGSSNFKSGPSIGTPCHFIKSVCCFHVHSFLFSFDFAIESIFKCSNLKSNIKHIYYVFFRTNSILMSIISICDLCNLCNSSILSKSLVAIISTLFVKYTIISKMASRICGSRFKWEPIYFIYCC